MTLKGHANTITGLRVSPDGTHLLSNAMVRPRRQDMPPINNYVGTLLYCFTYLPSTGLLQLLDTALLNRRLVDPAAASCSHRAVFQLLPALTLRACRVANNSAAMLQ